MENQTNTQVPENKSEDQALKRETELTDLSKMSTLPTDEKSRLERLNEKGHALLDKAKESLSGITSKFSGSNVSNEPIKEEDKDLKREDELTDISQMPNLPADEKTRLGKLTEKGHALFDKAKEVITSKVSKTSEVTEEGESKVEPVTESKTEEPVEGQIEGSTEEKGKSLIGNVKQGIQNVSGIISQKVENVKGMFKKGENAEEETNEKETGEGTEGFKEVTTGFSETIEELRHEQGEDEVAKELHSTNPFESLGDEKINIAQPLGNADIVGGDIKQLAEGTLNIDSLNAGEEAGDKTLVEKVKQGLSDVTSKISEKVSETKEKIKSTFVSTDKENAPTETA